MVGGTGDSSGEPRPPKAYRTSGRNAMRLVVTAAVEETGADVAGVQRGVERTVGAGHHCGQVAGVAERTVGLDGLDHSTGRGQIAGPVADVAVLGALQIIETMAEQPRSGRLVVFVTGTGAHADRRQGLVGQAEVRAGGHGGRGNTM